MGILGIPYVNATLGIDLLREKRPYIYFCSDSKIGCLNRLFFMVVRGDGSVSLYRHPQGSTKDYAPSSAARLKRMKTYMQAMLQITRILISKNLVSPPPGERP
jgi:hypothetical protein